MNCGKHELALFRMSFLADDYLKDPLKQLLHDKCAHVLRDDIHIAFTQGVQEKIGNVSTDGELVDDENKSMPLLRRLRLDDRNLHFGEMAGEGGHGSVNIYRSSKEPALSVAVKSPIAKDNVLETLAQCQRELALHLQAQVIARANEDDIQDLLMQMLDPDEDRQTSLADALVHPLFADETLGSTEARELIRSVGGLH